jgi:hypothetical protein
MSIVRLLAAEVRNPNIRSAGNGNVAAIAIAILDSRLVMHYRVPDQTTDRYLEHVAVNGDPMPSASPIGSPAKHETVFACAAARNRPCASRPWIGRPFSRVFWRPRPAAARACFADETCRFEAVAVC